MLQNKVTDPITDQEMAFAHQVLSGTMTDRQAAEAMGLNRESAAYARNCVNVAKRAKNIEFYADL